MTEVPRINDASFVGAEYSNPDRLAARAAFWEACQGPQPQDVALAQVLKLAPATVLEVGCGHGAFAAALVKAGIEVIATEQSQQMVERTAAQGVTARRRTSRTCPLTTGCLTA